MHKSLTLFLTIVVTVLSVQCEPLYKEAPPVKPDQKPTEALNNKEFADDITTNEAGSPAKTMPKPETKSEFKEKYLKCAKNLELKDDELKNTQRRLQRDLDKSVTAHDQLVKQLKLYDDVIKVLKEHAMQAPTLKSENEELQDALQKSKTSVTNCTENLAGCTKKLEDLQHQLDSTQKASTSQSTIENLEGLLSQCKSQLAKNDIKQQNLKVSIENCKEAFQEQKMLRDNLAKDYLMAHKEREKLRVDLEDCKDNNHPLTVQSASAEANVKDMQEKLNDLYQDKKKLREEFVTKIDELKKKLKSCKDGSLKALNLFAELKMKKIQNDSLLEETLVLVKQLEDSLKTCKVKDKMAGEQCMGGGKENPQNSHLNPQNSIPILHKADVSSCSKCQKQLREVQQRLSSAAETETLQTEYWETVAKLSKCEERINIHKQRQLDAELLVDTLRKEVEKLESLHERDRKRLTSVIDNLKKAENYYRGWFLFVVFLLLCALAFDVYHYVTRRISENNVTTLSDKHREKQQKNKKKI